MNAEVIRLFYDAQLAIIDVLYNRGEVSLAQTAQNTFAKSLAIAAASQFENALRDTVVRGITARTESDEYVLKFCHRKGIDRQYHTWFRWEDGNANVFFSLFGSDFLQSANALMNGDPEYREAMKSFVKIGHLRNLIVHNDFLTVVINDTPEEVLAHAVRAIKFIDLVERIIVPAGASTSSRAAS